MQKYFENWARNNVRITIFALLHTAYIKITTFGNMIFAAI
jgi:hypothetical protein